jgi:hypothetical protein
MAKGMGETYTNAGILKKAGRGIVLDIAGAEFFLIREDLNALMNNQAADLVNYDGDAEGIAWLSPLVSPRKADMTGVIAHRIYSVPYRGFSQVVSGDRQYTQVREYHSCRNTR